MADIVLIYCVSLETIQAYQEEKRRRGQLYVDPQCIHY